MSHLVSLALLFLTLAGSARAMSPAVWPSEAIAQDARLTFEAPVGATTRPASMPAVIVLRNLAFRPVDPDVAAAAVRQLLEAGNVVIGIDYDNDPRATVDALVKDLLKLRSDLKEKQLDLDPSIDLNRLWILPEGVGLKRDLTFFRNEQKTWQLDIAYPLNPPEPVPTLMEITCDNASRMGNFSLVYCRDTLLEGGLLRGFAAAMIDHPVPAPYKGLDDPMPDLIHRLKSAVRTIRAHAESSNLDGKIAALGFSRAGPMAAFLALTNGNGAFDVGGEHRGESSRVQAALVHGNRYDYSALRDDDPMRSRFEKAWGPFADNRERWLAHGAVHYLQETAAPLYLNTSDTESVEYREGLRHFRDRLAERGIAHEYVQDADGRGHQVTTDPQRLDRIYHFLRTALSEP